MKKFLVVLVVLAMTSFSAVAFAVDVSVDGSIDIRSRMFDNVGATGTGAPADLTKSHSAYTQERVRIGVNAKASDNLKGRIQIENDWDNWGRLEAPQGNSLTPTATTGRIDIREAWIDFMLPDLPVGVKVGHQFLQLGQGWFLRNMKYGDDAWLLYNGTANNTLAFVDIKVAEGATYRADQDVDAYALLDVYKIDDKNTVGVDVSLVDIRAVESKMYNVGLNYTGDLGVLKLKAEADIQAGKNKTTDAKFKGNQIVLQGTIPVNDLSINATLARGSGDKAGSADKDGIVTFMDADPHYTLIYEYQLATAAGNKHTGFANTTAASVGAGYKASKSLDLGLDFWYLRANEKPAGVTSDDLGWEIDAKVNWKLYDNLSWNWALGYFKPGDFYGSGTEKPTAVQGILSYKF